MAEVQGQAIEQPSAEDLALRFAEGVLRDEGQLPPEEDSEAKETPEVEAEAEEQSEETTEDTEAEAETEEAETEEEQPRRFKLKYKGEEKEFEETEVIELAQKGFDYTRKTQDLSRERESIQEKIRAEVDPKLKELDEKLGMAEAVLYNAIAPEMNNTDWAKLAEDDPAEWARRKAKVEGVQMQLQKVQAERQKVIQTAQKQQEDKLKKAVAEAREILQNDINGWGEDLYGKILKTAVSEYGFSQEEANAIFDARAIKVLHDAMQYRSLKAKPPEGKKVAPKVKKVLKPGAGEKKDLKTDKREKDWVRLRKSGKPTDALPILERMLEAEGITD